ncbi:MAG: DUF4270 domain-containing protein [Bacteroidetes bacterium]|jgi:hypothetical protein|nr:DUF4270 domain-containing protein [Bacteroidota bacterium]MDF1867092.1 DUF4270 family protein [Saprospiraceae bacterium]
MKNSILALIVLLAGFCLFNACNDPTSIGSDLLEGDQLDLDYTDTLTIISKTVRDADSVITFSTSSSTPASFRLSAYLAGNFDDPIFGRSESSIYSQVSLLSSIVPNFAKGEFLDEVSLDSIVLVLPWDSLGVYGDTLQEKYNLEVYEIDEIMPSDQDYYSDQSFAVKPNPIATVENLEPRPKTLVPAVQPQGESLSDTILANHLRIRLDESYSNAFFNADTLNFQNDTLFSEFFKGFHIKATSTNGGMLSFNLNSSNAGIFVYFHVDTTQSIYQFPTNFDITNTVKTVNFDHNYSGTDIETALTNGIKEDSIIFVQGMAGVTATLEFPYVESLGSILVNKAELELPIIQLEGDGEFDPISQLALEEILEDGTTRPINDLNIAASLGSGNTFITAFGGVVVNGDRYYINMSNQFQEMLNGGVSNKIKILVLNRSAKASRTVIGGASHSEFPLKLNLSYTRL